MAITIKEDEFLRVFKNSIKITARTISVKTLLSDRNLKRINYSPYYQRNYVWDIIKQSFFIESVILGTEIPPLIFFKSGLKIEVIDGRQRFETLKKFKDNEITLNRRGLMTLVNIAKQNFNKLEPDKLKQIFLESNIRVFEFEIINEPGLNDIIEDKIKKEIFRRYNTGITPLSSSEVDNAKYDKDELSELFKNELNKKEIFFWNVIDCFFPGDNVNTGIEDITNLLRRLCIIENFPISKYAKSKDRIETLDLLYDFVTQNIENTQLEFINFKEQIFLLHEIYNNITESENKLKNALIFECIFWAIRILQQEEVLINLNYNILKNHYKNNVYKYSISDSHYYGNIISRFEDTASVFKKITKFDFSIYIRNANFTSEFKQKISEERNSVQMTDAFDNLRINKPAPISTPVDEIISDIKTHKYLVRPSYQRKEKISELKASAIIESILLGINLPPIFVLKKQDIKEVIDGQQRLLSIIAFLGEQYMDETGRLQYSKNNLFKLKGLKILSEFNGLRISGIDEEYKEKILDFLIDIIIIDQNVNPNFEATDLFIRLNNKPYPIQQNSFEMWNSTVDYSVIQLLKETTKKHQDWFYLREIKKEENERTDRMENEELITILSFLTYNHIQNELFDKVLGFFTRIDRITCRLKNKTSLSDFLNRLDQIASDKEEFIYSIKYTDKLIETLKQILNNNVEKEFFNSFFNVKNSTNYKRSFQDFYILWIILLSYNIAEFNYLTNTFYFDLAENLNLLKNADKIEINESYLQSFVNKLKQFYN